VRIFSITSDCSMKARRIYGREMYETWYKMTMMLQSGLDVKSILTRRFPVERFREAFDVMQAGNCGKVLLEWL
jgi:threonine 3-dehydrogenase